VIRIEDIFDLLDQARLFPVLMMLVVLTDLMPDRATAGRAESRIAGRVAVTMTFEAACDSPGFSSMATRVGMCRIVIWISGLVGRVVVMLAVLMDLMSDRTTAGRAESRIAGHVAVAMAFEATCNSPGFSPVTTRIGMCSIVVWVSWLVGRVVVMTMVLMSEGCCPCTPDRGVTC
jgi:hypothetical protein